MLKNANQKRCILLSDFDDLNIDERGFLEFIRSASPEIVNAISIEKSLPVWKSGLDMPVKTPAKHERIKTTQEPCSLTIGIFMVNCKY